MVSFAASIPAQNTKSATNTPQYPSITIPVICAKIVVPNTTKVESVSLILSLAVASMVALFIFSPIFLL